MIPVYNEASAPGGTNLDGVLRTLLECQRLSLLQRVIVVDDGCTDRTCDTVSRSQDIVLLRHTDYAGRPERRGKAQAFATAAKYARRQGADALLMTDADMVGLKPEHVLRLLEPLKEGVSMTRMTYNQDNPGGEFPVLSVPLEVSGLRALKLDAALPLLEKRHPLHERWSPYFSGPGFALELALEHLIGRDSCREARLPCGGYPFSRPRGGGAAGPGEVAYGVEYARKLIRQEAAARSSLRP